MNRNERNFISKFVESVKKEYPEIIINYTHEEDVDTYDIWHNSYVLQFEDKSFLKFVGMKMRDLLYDNNIFNFSFAYKHTK